jgi:hypothetical protein
MVWMAGWPHVQQNVDKASMWQFIQTGKLDRRLVIGHLKFEVQQISVLAMHPYYRAAPHPSAAGRNDFQDQKARRSTLQYP